MYHIIVEQKARKEIDALPNNILQLIIDAIGTLKINPRPHGVKKLAGENAWRIRVRHYRVLYTIDDQERLITVYRVKHRKDAYR